MLQREDEGREDKGHVSNIGRMLPLSDEKTGYNRETKVWKK